MAKEIYEWELVLDPETAFEFLDDLRASGATNMFGGGRYLVEEFGIDRRTAREVLMDWMKLV